MAVKGLPGIPLRDCSIQVCVEVHPRRCTSANMKRHVGPESRFSTMLTFPSKPVKRSASAEGQEGKNSAIIRRSASIRAVANLVQWQDITDNEHIPHGRARLGEYTSRQHRHLPDTATRDPLTHQRRLARPNGNQRKRATKRRPNRPPLGQGHPRSPQNRPAAIHRQRERRPRHRHRRSLPLPRPETALLSCARDPSSGEYPRARRSNQQVRLIHFPFPVKSRSGKAKEKT